MGGLLRKMLLEWRVACPRRDGALHRVFQGPGSNNRGRYLASAEAAAIQQFQKSRLEVGASAFGIAARHPSQRSASLHSTRQAQGIELGLVAKLAGHANANVALGHYTQAVRGGENAVAALEPYTAPVD